MSAAVFVDEEPLRAGEEVHAAAVRATAAVSRRAAVCLGAWMEDS
ncbi:hypothetical protein AB0M25_19830 [Streptomyces griseomycini]